MNNAKDKNTALILCLFGFVGIGGLHHFYGGNIGKGILYLFTGGLFLIGTIIDLIKIVNGTFFKSPVKMVWVTNSNSVYHTDIKCPALNIHNAKQLTISQAKNLRLQHCSRCQN